MVILKHKKSGQGGTVLLSRYKGLATGRTKPIIEKHILVMREDLGPVLVSGGGRTAVHSSAGLLDTVLPVTGPDPARESHTECRHHPKVTFGQTPRAQATSSLQKRPKGEVAAQKQLD